MRRFPGGRARRGRRPPLRRGAGGRCVAFTTGGPLDPADSDFHLDVCLRDRVNGTTTRVSTASARSQADDCNCDPSLCDDGSALVFMSRATNLVAGDSNALEDCFVKELATIAIVSDATNLLDADPGFGQSYVRHRPNFAASTRSHGSGLPGTLATPTLRAVGVPVVNGSLVLGADDSAATATIGLLILGEHETSLALRHGTLLVEPLYGLPVVVDVAGWSATFAVPYQEPWVGAAAYAQLFELDAGAVGGIAMTQGLELVGGY